jgi:peptidoglycan hydrolase-like protein with peptidoglycan-binding domain
MANSQVKYLQEALNMSGLTEVAATGPGSPGNESTYFGNATKNAVIMFQDIFSDDILTPAGLAAGNGFVGSATRAKITALCKG